MDDNRIITRLHELYLYDAECGRIRSKKTGKILVGKERGRKSDTLRYRYHDVYFVGGFQKTMQEHRIVWAIVYGSFPVGHIDHIDRNPLNNRIENLRDVSPAENQKNKSLHSNNKTGVNGVQMCKLTGRFLADGSLKIGGIRKRFRIGLFDTIFEAAAARKSYELKHGFSHSHGLRIDFGGQSHE